MYLCNTRKNNENMKHLSINMLKYNPTSQEPLDTDEYSFWVYYLELLQVKTGKFLSDKEVKALAYVLAGEPNASYFKRPLSKDFEETLGVNNNHLHQIKDTLLKKKIIMKTDIRGDYVLIPNLAKSQSQLKERLYRGEEIEFRFKLKLNAKGNNENSTEI